MKRAEYIRSWLPFVATVVLLVASAPLDAQEKTKSAGPAAPMVSPSREVAAAVARGRALRNEGKLEEARTVFEEALTKARAATDRSGEALALNNIASVYRYQAGLTRITENQSPPADLVEKAAKLYAEAAGTARGIQDKPNEAYAALYLGVLEAARGDFDKAFKQYEEALAIFKAIDDPYYTARTFMLMGATALHRQQQPEAAVRYFEQALPKFRDAKYWHEAQWVVRDMDKAYQLLADEGRLRL